MEKTKKNKIVYNIVSFLTLAIPVPVYLIVMSCVFSITPNYTIAETSLASVKENAVVEVVELEDDKSINYLKFDNTKLDYTISGDTVTIEDNFTILTFDDSTIILIKDEGYFKLTLSETNVLTWNNYSKELIEKEMNYKIPISVTISLLAMVIIALLVFRKMDFAKKHPRLSVLLSLGLGTGILVVLETIITSMTDVFLVATLTWLAYCVEYIIYNRKTLFNTTIDKDEILTKLNDTLKGGK